ncbi:XisH family protein [Leptolyngbya sp. AN02str]|uniref:XisH family protein n=1 Tax=Leptolyngbya sp. AN02str TaxID=3423363 RepID=UPI003D3173CB
MRINHHALFCHSNLWSLQEDTTAVSTRDLFHQAVRRGLEKEQWYISSDPLELEWEEVKVKIDLAAERLLAAERGEEKIAVEIKSFISPSPISDFHTALGQFLNYKIMLEVNQPDRQLYLAVPLDTYEIFFQSRFAQVAIKRHHLNLIVYNPITEEIVTWIN